jgi:hypothetical protein
MSTEKIKTKEKEEDDHFCAPQNKPSTVSIK